MIPVLSVVTSVKDYFEVVHKLIEYDSESFSKYTELGPLVTYLVLSLKNFIMDFISLSWLKNIWSLPILIPDISSAMISEISVLDGYFHNAFNFLETPALSPNEKTIGLITGIEKFTIGILNSCFLFLPTSTAHIITLRRFVMQGLEAGYISGLGTIAGNVFWLASIILGWRFFVIPWLSLDILRYVLGFALLVKYMWDSYNERKMVLEDLSKRKIFLLNFLLALTEQTSIYPFISNISISPEASILETFPAENYTQFILIHVCYLLGIAVGSFCLLQFTCWFWENPAFKLYMWVISSFKVSTSSYYKALNFIFLYLTMLSAISSIPYYGLDYTITNPLGFVNDDRLIQDKSVLETSFLGSKASDRNTRRNRGRHGRRERWKRRIRKYRTFDASLYDQGIYDLFTIEDLNYGFDRFWLRRKLRNHRVRFRFFPGPWMRSFKKQLAKPRLESYTGPRIEFFRILFEQVYHPSFHARSQGSNPTSPISSLNSTNNINLKGISNKEFHTMNRSDQRDNINFATGETRESTRNDINSYLNNKQNTIPIKGIYGIKDNLIHENSMLRKFARKLDSRLKTSEIVRSLNSNNITSNSIPSLSLKQGGQPMNALNTRTENLDNNIIYSKRWKEIFSKIYHEPKTQIPTSNIFFKNVHRNFYNSSLVLPNKINLNVLDPLDQKQIKNTLKINKESIKKQSSRINTLSNKDLQVLRYRSTLTLPKNIDINTKENFYSTPRKDNFSTKKLSKENSRLVNPSDSATDVALEVPVNKSSNEGIEEKFSPNSLSEISNFTKSEVKSNKPFIEENSKEFSSSFVLLHPLKFYLQQEAALQRKLRYYTPNIFRKLSVENNAPYFRVMMRRYFYNYKPTNRWERTMKVGSFRKARRKTTRTPRKLRLPQFISTESTSMGLGKTTQSGVLSSGNSPRPSETYSNTIARLGTKADETGDSARKENLTKNSFGLQEKANLAERIQKPTFNYSVVSKKASRYRYQIYKDVMQHWYYSPFNRLLLKFDVDSFIRRQPKTHFLTSKEENLLHLRRFFLSEHYNTLRWYTNMEHYRTMKTKIGGSKSFSSRAYNQQFAGTFKKIRHLFAITPTINSSFPFDGSSTSSEGNKWNSPLDTRTNFNTKEPQQDTNVLKFDQPLYNEYPNNSKNSLLNPLVIHEELLNSSSNSNSPRKSEEPSLMSLQDSDRAYSRIERPFMESNEDLLTQSQKVVREYLNNSSEARKDYIKQLLDNKNYASLTDFLYNGQKLRGNKPTTNQKILNNQEKEYLLTPLEKETIEKQYNSPEVKRILRENLNDIVSGPYVSKGEKTKPLPARASLENLYTTFLKNWKRRVNNQESLKNYLTRRIDKREKRKITKEKTLQKKFKLLNDWFLNRRYQENLSITRGVQRKFSSDVELRTGESKDDRTKLQQINDQNSQLITSGLQKAIGDGINTANSDTQLSLNGTNILKLNNSLDVRTNKIDNRSSVKNLETLHLYQKQKLNREIQTATNKLHIITKKLDKKPISSRSVKVVKNKISSILKTLKNTYGGLSLLNFNQITQLVKPIKQKSLTNWRKKQRAIGKQKLLRKEFKLLLTKKQTAQQTGLSIPNRKKRIPSESTNNSLHNVLANDTTEKNSFFNNNLITSFFNFRREASPQRRYRVRRNRGVFRKRNLGDLIKKDIKIFFNKNIFTDVSSAPQDILERNRFYTKVHTLKNGSTTYKTDTQKTENYLQGQINTNPLQFKEARVKQRKNKQRKLRSWKQNRMALRVSQKRRQYLKRRRYSISKIRVLSKQFKRVKNKIEIHNWWWKQYLPSIKASTDALWQIEKDRLIQQKLAELSPQQIIQRDTKTFNNKLQIGNKDFKPLALPEAMRIQSTFNSDAYNNLPLSTFDNNLSSYQTTPDNTLENRETSQIVNRLYENLLVNQNKNSVSNLFNSSNNMLTNSSTSPIRTSSDFKTSVNNTSTLFNQTTNISGLLPNTSLPFYAGWDESLRKFVVTNRLLSRQDAGYEVDKSFIQDESKNLSSSFVSPDSNINTSNSFQKDSSMGRSSPSTSRTSETDARIKENFTEAPLQGMNAATTLYWQIPFTTYDPDQFFALGMDGFSPIAWRKMLFRHSILKTWLGDKTISSKNTDLIPSSIDSSTVGIKNTLNHKDLLSTLQKTKKSNSQSAYSLNSNSQDGFNASRRLKKRLLRVKKHPRTPAWFPSGPLLNQVLPVHYIYVFYKRSRLPRNRYLSRRLLNVNNINNSETFNSLVSSNPSFYNYDFTLRKRLKPKRKYHLKHDSSIVIPRRLKFLNWSQSKTNRTNIDSKQNLQQDINSLIRWRPLSSKKINKSFSELMNEQKTLRAKRQQRLAGVNPMEQSSLRVKQLKRRVQRQVIRAIWRYRPRAGGFVWPGDYLKLQAISAPKLRHTNTTEINISDSTSQNKNIDNSPKRKTKRKKKRTLVEWQTQPKKYLYEKHNIKVLKKKLERAGRSGNIPLKQKVKELNYQIQ
jgi:hypothetical protein